MRKSRVCGVSVGNAMAVNATVDVRLAQETGAGIMFASSKFQPFSPHWWR